MADYVKTETAEVIEYSFPMTGVNGNAVVQITKTADRLTHWQASFKLTETWQTITAALEANIVASGDRII